MIVIGLDVHKQSVTAVAIDEAGRELGQKLIEVGSTELPGWASELGADRLWAVEDCRQLTRWLERQLLALGEEVVRVPPKLTVPERRGGRTRGKWTRSTHWRSRAPHSASPISAALGPTSGSIARSSCLSTIATTSSTSDAGHSSGSAGISSNSIQPSWCPCGCSLAPRTSNASAVGSHASGKISRSVSPVNWSRTAARSTARSPSSITNSSCERRRPRQLYSSFPAARPSPPPSCSPRSAPSTASRAMPNSPATPAPRPLEASSGRTQRHRLDRAGNRQLNAALYRIAITQARYHEPARTYLERKRSEGKSRREAIRCLKRLLVRAVFQTLKASPTLT